MRRTTNLLALREYLYAIVKAVVWADTFYQYFLNLVSVQIQRKRNRGR